MFFTTDFSFESAVKSGSVPSIAKKLGYKAAVICDNTLSGAIEFYKKCKAEGIKPVIGLRKKIDGIEYLFLSKNKKGYEELCYFESKGVDDRIFESENIIPIAVYAVENRKIKAEYGFLRFPKSSKDILSNKIISSALPKEKVTRMEIANCETEKDFYTLVSLKALLEKRFVTDVFSFDAPRPSVPLPKSEVAKDSVLIEIFSQVQDDYDFGHPVPPDYKFVIERRKEFNLPVFDMPKAGNFWERPEYREMQTDLFEKIAKWGLLKRIKEGYIFPEKRKEYEERLEYEISVFKKMGFEGYMLIVWDFIHYAKKRKIPVGPGRGSAAGSLVSYCMYITDIDPIRWSLLFERFLNPERVSLPDIDVDFCQERREEVIEYVTEKYGEANTAQVITFGSIAAKAAIRDGARIIQAPLYVADILAKHVKDSIEDAEEASRSETLDPIALQVIQKAKQIEGYKRNTGVHAAGFVISNDPIYFRAPLYDSHGTRVVGYEGIYLEDVNLVKYDFLGLKTLSIISETLKFMGNENDPNALNNIDPNDPNFKDVYQMISEGKTKGVFQIESEGMKDLAVRLKPDNFNDLIAMIALYRPGPMDSGMLDEYVERKKGRKPVSYLFDSMRPALEPILKPTYGVIIYQEQVMEIVKKIAGFSLGEADLVRRAMGKKKEEEMKRIRADFVERAVKNGYTAEESSALFDMIEKFARYGFNKSHSAAYAQITFLTAYLKKRASKEFMSALLNFETSDSEKMAEYIEEAFKIGVPVEKPDFMLSSYGFEPSKEKKSIVFGLKGIKGVGSSMKDIVNIRREISIMDPLEFINYMQRDVKTEINAIEKEISKLSRKESSLFKKLQTRSESKLRLEKKFSEKGRLTDKEKERLEKYKAEVEELNKEIEEVSKTISKLNDSKKDLEKEAFSSQAKQVSLDKRTLEALIESGAFDAYGWSRKIMKEKMKAILGGKIKSHEELKGEDFSDIEKIVMELERMSYTFSGSIGDRECIILETMQKKKKSGDFYTFLKVFYNDPDEGKKIIEVSDFNNVAKNVQAGERGFMLLSKKGKYYNLQKFSKKPIKVKSEDFGIGYDYYTYLEMSS